MDQPIITTNRQDKGVPLPLAAPSAERASAPAADLSLYLLLKRLGDVVLSLLGLAVCFLPLLVVALCICGESRGPALYRRRVLARQEWEEAQGEDALQQFDAYKLRTMIADADGYLLRHPELMQDYQKDWKLHHDPRITRLGVCLRSFSIDELPQLLNVLRGQMTLVGPRMITAPELARYGSDAPELLRVKPGLTGLWQVSGRQDLPYEERVRLDMAYIRSRSLRLDAHILFQTVRCVLLRQGAY